jgi:hypothetical protein
MSQDYRARVLEAQIKTNEKMATWTQVVGVFTAALAIVSFLTLLAVGVQSYMAWEAATDNREQLRAILQFASVQSFSGPAADTGEQIYGFSPVIQNFGSTRANDAYGWDSVAYYEGSIPNNIDFSQPRNAIDTPHGILGPNAQLIFSPVTLKATEVDAAERKAGVIVIWGRFAYFDIYSPQLPRLLFFCQRLTPTKTKEGLIVFAAAPLRPECNKSAT